MDKPIKFKPKFFSIRINIMAIFVVATTVLVLSISDIDKGIYTGLASPFIFTFLLLLVHSNRIEVQSIYLKDSKFELSFFNQNSIFFRSPSIELDRTEIKTEVKNKKVVIFSNDKVVGILRLDYLENVESNIVIEEYFKESKN